MKYPIPVGVLYRTHKNNEPLAMMAVSIEQKMKAMVAAHELSWHCRREGTFPNIVEQYWWPVMYVNIMDWVKTWEQHKKRAPLWYEEPLKSQTISHVWQRVGMDIVYMPIMDNGVSPTSGSQGIPQWVGGCKTTNVGYIRDSSRLHS